MDGLVWEDLEEVGECLILARWDVGVDLLKGDLALSTFDGNAGSTVGGTLIAIAKVPIAVVWSDLDSDPHGAWVEGGFGDHGDPDWWGSQES